MNTVKLYDLMQQLIEHKRMEGAITEQIVAEMDIKVGDVIGKTVLHAGRKVISIEPQLIHKGVPPRWIMEALITYKPLRRNGQFGKGHLTTEHRQLVVDWLCSVPKASEPRLTIADMVSAQRESENALAAVLAAPTPDVQCSPAAVTAFEQTVAQFSHANDVIDRRAKDRRK